MGSFRCREVLGVGQLFALSEKDGFGAAFHCRAVKDLKERVWASASVYVTLPVYAIRVLTPGSLWQYGRKISGNTYSGHWVNLSSYVVTYVDASLHLRPEEVRQRLQRAKCPKSEFLLHVNHIVFESLHARIVIPSAELFRHYLCPTKAYAIYALTYEFSPWLCRIMNRNNLSMPIGRSKFSEKEIFSTSFFSSSIEAVDSAALPYKTLQITNLNNTLMIFRKNMLLKFMMPFGNNVKLRVTGQTIEPDRRDKLQLHSLIVERIQESACT